MIWRMKTRMAVGSSKTLARVELTIRIKSEMITLLQSATTKGESFAFLLILDTLIRPGFSGPLPLAHEKSRFTSGVFVPSRWQGEYGEFDCLLPGYTGVWCGNSRLRSESDGYCGCQVALSPQRWSFLTFDGTCAV